MDSEWSHDVATSMNGNSTNETVVQYPREASYFAAACAILFVFVGIIGTTYDSEIVFSFTCRLRTHRKTKESVRLVRVLSSVVTPLSYYLSAPNTRLSCSNRFPWKHFFRTLILFSFLHFRKLFFRIVFYLVK